MSLMIRWEGVKAGPRIANANQRATSTDIVQPIQPARSTRCCSSWLNLSQLSRYVYPNLFSSPLRNIEILLSLSLSLSLYVSFCVMYIFFSNRFHMNNEQYNSMKGFSSSRLFFCLFKLMKIHHTSTHTHTEGQHQA